MAELFRSTDDLVSALKRPKFVVFPCPWVPPNNAFGQRRLTIRASLSDGTATIQGIGLRVECNPEGFSLPFTIVLTAEYKRKPRAIARIDINAQQHENRLAVCGDLQFQDAGTTHFHDTELHRHIELSKLLDDPLLDLPVARPISDMSKDFSAAMEKCGERCILEI